VINFVKSTNKSNVGSFIGDDDFYTLEGLINTANTEKLAKDLKDLAHSKLDSFARMRFIDEAQDQFGTLKGCVGTKYPAATAIAEVGHG
jgi:hypothetical protein